MFHPVHTYIAKFVTNFEARELHHTIFEDGKLVYSIPTIKEIQDFAKENLDVLWDEYKRTLNPADYPVNLSQACWDNKMQLIEEVREKVNARVLETE
ncbi:nicotinate phosphoribosyltransferase [compost metagenome]